MKLGKFLILFFVVFLGQANPIRAQEQPKAVDIFKKGYIQVSAKSEGKQSRFQAVRSAEVLAQLELVKILQKIKIYGSQEIGQNTQPTEIEGFLKGALACGSTYHEEQGFAEVCLRLNLHGPKGLYHSVLPWLKENQIGPELKTAYDTPAAPDREAHDGLILDVRRLPFQPALLNRILTFQDALVFDPLQLKLDFLIEHGCSGYVSDMQEARRVLSQWGSSNPLLLAVRELDQFTDVKISPQEAALLLAAEKDHEVLSRAKIVFLLQE